MSEPVQEKRRNEVGGPPTIIMASYQAMGQNGRRRLRIAGGCMTTFGIGMPMVAELFMSLSWVYWVFSGFVAITGVSFIWPELGVLLFNVIPSILERFWPAKKSLLRPERRAPRDEIQP